MSRDNERGWRPYLTTDEDEPAEVGVRRGGVRRCSIRRMTSCARVQGGGFKPPPSSFARQDGLVEPERSSRSVAPHVRVECRVRAVNFQYVDGDDLVGRVEGHRIDDRPASWVRTPPWGSLSLARNPFSTKRCV